MKTFTEWLQIREFSQDGGRRIRQILDNLYHIHNYVANAQTPMDYSNIYNQIRELMKLLPDHAGTLEYLLRAWENLSRSMANYASARQNGNRWGHDPNELYAQCQRDYQSFEHLRKLFVQGLQRGSVR